MAWAGDDSTGRACFSDADEVLELRGALVTPCLRRRHVHATSTGMLAIGLDLTGCATLAQCLELVAQQSRPGTVLWGHGWDETSWPEGRPPTARTTGPRVTRRCTLLPDRRAQRRSLLKTSGSSRGGDRRAGLGGRGDTDLARHITTPAVRPGNDHSGSAPCRPRSIPDRGGGPRDRGSA